MEFMGFLRTVVQKHAFNVLQTKAYIHGARLFRTGLAARQSEDCLYLNVRTASPLVLGRVSINPAARNGDLSDGNESPSEGECEMDNSTDDERNNPGKPHVVDELFPVIVYIHGGDYHDGAGGSRPFYAANALPVKGRVVLVTFNYRLGLIGHFTHPELSREAEEEGRGNVSGNYGILDQVKKVLKVLGAKEGTVLNRRLWELPFFRVTPFPPPPHPPIHESLAQEASRDMRYPTGWRRGVPILVWLPGVCSNSSSGLWKRGVGVHFAV